MNSALSTFVLGCCLLVLAGCASTADVEQIGGISGTAVSGEKPLPEGTMLSFMNVEVDESFVTQVNSDGTYHYRPYRGVPVKMGTYKVVVMPPAPKTILKDGLQVRDPSDKDTYPQIAQKYRSKATTPLEVEVGASSVDYPIRLQ